MIITLEFLTLILFISPLCLVISLLSMRDPSKHHLLVLFLLLLVSLFSQIEIGFARDLSLITGDLDILSFYAFLAQTLLFLYSFIRISFFPPEE